MVIFDLFAVLLFPVHTSPENEYERSRNHHTKNPDVAWYRPLMQESNPNHAKARFASYLSPSGTWTRTAAFSSGRSGPEIGEIR